MSDLVAVIDINLGAGMFINYANKAGIEPVKRGNHGKRYYTKDQVVKILKMALYAPNMYNIDREKKLKKLIKEYSDGM
jgi:DNA-binding transcriptional MerR regulator